VPAEQPETPYRLRNRWLAAIGVSLCYGFSAFFVTGDSEFGLGWFLAVMGIFAAVLLLTPRRRIVEKPLSAYIQYGVLVLLVPFLALWIGLRRTPWSDLEAGYRTDRPVPAGLDAGEEVVLLQPVNEIQVKPFPLKGATTSFADDGVYLALSWPLSMVYDPLWLPVRALETCRPSGIDTMYTSLGVRGVGARVEVLDPAEDVIDWCRDKGIGDGRERPEGLL
jgi:hypothetical protein